MAKLFSYLRTNRNTKERHESKINGEGRTELSVFAETESVRQSTVYYKLFLYVLVVVVVVVVLVPY